jgi:dihydroorotate dehydrogenase
MYSLVRPLLFRLDPEQAHNLTLRLLRISEHLPPMRALLRRLFAVPQAPLRVFGLHFSNPVGLAAGYDKDGLAWRSLACLGFGHIEVGTVTHLPQPGNPHPRVFRLPEDQAVINRMGFPSLGAQFVADHLQGQRPPGLVLGVNLGKNKDTPLELAWQDYEQLIDIFAPLADYLVVNVSSPNTVGLRKLQARHNLEALLAHVARRRDAFAGKRVPVLVKLSPDLSDGELEDALQALLGAGMDGVIATNTTINRPHLGSPYGRESGGLSGAPLTTLSARFVREIVRRTDGKLPVVAAGGIMNADDARRRLDDGAALVQLYTGLIYAGPRLVQQTIKALGGEPPISKNSH